MRFDSSFCRRPAESFRLGAEFLEIEAELDRAGADEDGGEAAGAARLLARLSISRSRSLLFLRSCALFAGRSSSRSLRVRFAESFFGGSTAGEDAPESTGLGADFEVSFFEFAPFVAPDPDPLDVFDGLLTVFCPDSGGGCAGGDGFDDSRTRFASGGFGDD
eukprot:SAG31_NODE_509_length_14732_cov_13.043600_5_plen_162_part_00